MQPTSYLCVLNARTLDCVQHRMYIDAIQWEKIRKRQIYSTDHQLEWMSNETSIRAILVELCICGMRMCIGCPDGP
jgi:hypothetical protein